MQFLHKVEAAKRKKKGKIKPIKPKKATSAKKPISVRKAFKPTKPVQPIKYLGKEATAKIELKISQMNLFKKMAFPVIKRFATGLNTEDLFDARMGKFYYKVAPIAMAYVLVDLNLITEDQIEQAILYFQAKTKQ